MRVALYVLGIAVMASALQVSVGAIAAPEIDGGSAVSALGLLSGSILVLRARWKR